MGYKIEGNGTWIGTKIWRNGELLQGWERCFVIITPLRCDGYVDGEAASLDRIILNGVYTVVGNGKFSNTKIFIADEMLRGVQSLELEISKHHETRIIINAVFLPNIIEGDDGGDNKSTS